MGPGELPPGPCPPPPGQNNTVLPTEHNVCDETTTHISSSLSVSPPRSLPLLSLRHVALGCRNSVSMFPASLQQPKQKPQKPRRVSGSGLTLAIAFLYLMTACWISVWTLMFPSPHGTTTRVRPKHTVTFMLQDPSSVARDRSGTEEEEGSDGKNNRDMNLILRVRIPVQPSRRPAARARSGGLPPRTTLLCVVWRAFGFKTTCLAALWLRSPACLLAQLKPAGGQGEEAGSSTGTPRCGRLW